CLANGSGGQLFLGVEDDGTVTGLHVNHQAQPELLVPFIASRTVPPLSVQVDVVELPADEERLPVAIIHVPVSTQPIATTAGRLLVRYLNTRGAPGCRPLYPHELTIWQADLGLLDATAQPVYKATWDDLDPLEFARLRRLIEENRGDSVLLELSDRELAHALQIVTTIDQEQMLPTLAGLLLLGKESALRNLMPAHEVAFQVLHGTDVAINEFHRWPLLRIHEWLFQAVEVRNEERELMIQGVRIGVPRYDRRGIREAIHNALIHRDYQKLGAIHVQLHDDYILISSPGGFVTHVRIDNLLVVPPRPRNPLLADAFKRIGLVERSGRGVSIIYAGQLRNGRCPPNYARSTEAGVTVVLDSSPADLVFVERIIHANKRLERQLNVPELLILSEDWVAQSITLDEAATVTQGDLQSTRHLLRRMTEEKLITPVTSEPTAIYKLGPLMLDTEGRIGVGSTIKISSTEALKKQILTYVQQYGQIQRKQVQAMSEISKDQAYRLLRQLVDQGKLVLVGRGRASHYRAAETNKRAR
ncbi:MAG: ATP-binding protein, partial [Chloroflexota bacterium]|nr:ATP-binding protein [Chloroflexota bacterium]